MAKSSELLNNAEHWRDRAEEARIHVEQLTDPNAKRMMLEIAQSYDKLATDAEERRSVGGKAHFVDLTAIDQP